MQISVPKIITNDDALDFPFVEIAVHFYDELTSPHFGAEVIVFLEKSNLSLAEIRGLAIQKAKDFLSKIVSDH